MKSIIKSVTMQVTGGRNAHCIREVVRLPTDRGIRTFRITLQLGNNYAYRHAEILTSDGIWKNVVNGDTDITYTRWLNPHSGNGVYYGSDGEHVMQDWVEFRAAMVAYIEKVWGVPQQSPPLRRLQTDGNGVFWLDHPTEQVEPAPLTVGRYSCQACSAPARQWIAIDECGLTMICDECEDELDGDRTSEAFYSLPDDPRLEPVDLTLERMLEMALRQYAECSDNDWIIVGTDSYHIDTVLSEVAYAV